MQRRFLFGIAFLFPNRNDGKPSMKQFPVSSQIQTLLPYIHPDRKNILLIMSNNTIIEQQLLSHCIAPTLHHTVNDETKYDCIICEENTSEDVINQILSLTVTSDCQYLLILKSSERLSEFENKLIGIFTSNIKTITAGSAIIVSKEISDWERIRKIAAYCYSQISPTKDNDQQDGERILRDGYGLCGSSSRAAKYLAKYYGMQAKVATFRMEGLPFGRGEKKWDTHTICEIRCHDGRWVVCDAMANICYPYSLSELLDYPQLADEYYHSIHFQPDERWKARRYEWYSTSKAYKLAVSMKYPKVWFSTLKKHIQKLKD